MERKVCIGDEVRARCPELPERDGKPGVVRDITEGTGQYVVRMYDDYQTITVTECELVMTVRMV